MASHIELWMGAREDEVADRTGRTDGQNSLEVQLSSVTGGNGYWYASSLTSSLRGIIQLDVTKHVCLE